MNYAIAKADEIQARRDWPLEMALAYCELQAQSIELPLQETGRPVFYTNRGYDSIKEMYFIQCNEFVKIGTTNNIKKRLSTMQVGCPYTLYVVCSFSNLTLADEFKIHSALNRYRRNGEWFLLPEEIMNSLKSLPDNADFYHIETAIRRSMKCTNDAERPE